MFARKTTFLRTLWWLLISALCFSQSLQAQSYIADIRKISVEDGLSSRFVNTIHKDSEGFMWIATQYGLNRYDGYEFKYYTAENSALRSNNIQHIYEDAHQQLWLVNKNIYEKNSLKTIDILNLQNGRIQAFEQVFKKKLPFAVEDIEFIHSDAGKTIWISTRKGTVFYQKDNRFEHVFSATQQESLEIFHTNERFLWLRGKNLLRVNRQNHAIDEFPYKKSLKKVGVDQNGQLWLLQRHQKDFLQYVNEKSEQLQKIDLQTLGLPENIYTYSPFKECFFNPVDHLIWCKDSSNHFFVFHPHKGLVYNFQSKMQAWLTYKNLGISHIYFGADERTWVATHDGIFIITLKKSKFGQLLTHSKEHYSTRGIVKDQQGCIYINTYKGRMLIHPKKGQIEKNSDKNIAMWMGVTKDKDGTFWYSSQKPLIEHYDPVSGEREYYQPDTTLKELPWEQWAIIRDKTGRVWTGTHQGLYYLEPATRHHQKFRQYNAFSVLEKSTIYHLLEDQAGIWIAASSGLYRLIPGRGITARYSKTSPLPYSIPYDHILHCYHDKKGIFWLATKGGGLIRFDQKTGTYRQFTTADGLSSNIIYAVYEDGYNKLWLSSNYGLMQFDKKNYQVSTYLTGDGISHNEFNINSHYQDSDGKLYFGGLEGITIINPTDFIKKDSLSHPFKITHCQVLNGKTGELTDKTLEVLHSGNLILLPHHKSFNIRFALLNYERSRQNKYAYKIEGLDKKWTPLQENSLRINALPYGNYTLHIKGQSTKGQWSRHQLSIPVIVHKPFYKKAWFVYTLIFVLCFLIYGIFYWRIQSLKQAKVRLKERVKQGTMEISLQKNKIEQQTVKLLELDKVKSRFFANISHELRTPLTLISGHIGVILKEEGATLSQKVRSALHISKQNGKRLLKMIEEILDLSKLESGQLHVHEKAVDFYPLISRLYDMFRSYSTTKQLDFSLKYELPDNLTLALDEDKFEKILGNLLSNAAKYTDTGGSILLKVDETKREKTSAEALKKAIRIQVSDTGRGIHPNDLSRIFERFYQSGQADAPTEGGTGIGLALAKELAELMGGTLRVESEWGKGSTFCFTMPKKICPPIDIETAAAIQNGTPIPHGKSTRTENAVREQMQAEEVPKKEETPKYKKQTPAILIVEDHPEMRAFTREVLEPHYRIREAFDGMDALKKLKKYKTNLVVSDVMMPRMDGFELLKQLKQDKKFGSLAMVMLTARAANEDKLQALNIGVDDYLSKPFDPEELLARVRNLLKNQLEREEWKEKIKVHDKEEAFVPRDQQFVQEVSALVHQELSNSQLIILDLAEAFHMSEAQLYRKIKSFTGLSPKQFVREIRLQEARKLLENKTMGSISEVMYTVGFQDSGYFAKRYTERFGKLPSEYF